MQCIITVMIRLTTVSLSSPVLCHYELWNIQATFYQWCTYTHTRN